MEMTRRGAVAGAAALLAPGAASPAAHRHVPLPAPPVPDRRPDIRLEIVQTTIELGHGVSVPTRTYNGQFPGPLLRMTAGKPVVVEVANRTGAPEQLHWHGQFLPVAVDGAEEEGTPAIPARGRRRIAFTPGPSGLRFYHSHTFAGRDLTRGFYSGLAGPVFVNPARDAGAYDQEVFLTLKEFAPRLMNMEMGGIVLQPINPVRELFDLDRVAVRAAERQRKGEGFNPHFSHYTINGRMLGSAPPIRVRRGQRVMFHLVNASASEIHGLALPGHTFRVVALDGNPVPRPAEVPALWIAPGERISAVVTMNQPGVWVLGHVADDAREKGMGVVVEYAGSAGPPQWRRPQRSMWDYRWFARPGAVARAPDETLTLTFATRYSSRDGFNEFTVNGRPFSMKAMQPRFDLRLGRRYRLRMRNATDEAHPIHLHRHSFELTSVAGFPTAGILKDVAMIGAFQEMTVDFTADQPGLSLLHCHMQHHMDYGFMALFDAR